MIKLLVWGTVLFGLYSAWCYLPVWREPSHLAGAVENILKHHDHTTVDGVFREKTRSAASGRELLLDPEEIDIRREQRSGERIVTVRFEMPVRITWLGQEKTLLRPVEARHHYAVDESREKARLDRIAHNERVDRHNQRVAKAAHDEYQRRVRAECAKGNGDFVVESVMVTMSDGERHGVPCDAVRHW